MLTERKWDVRGSVRSPGPRSGFRVLAFNGGVALLLGLAVLAMARVDFKSGAGPDGGPGAGIVTHSEVQEVWIPRAFLEWAGEDANAPGLDGEGVLRSRLAALGDDPGWYAIARRGVQADGGAQVITQVRFLRDSAAHLRELGSVIATAAGRPPRDRGLEFGTADVRVIPDRVRSARSLDAIRAFLASPAAADEAPPREEGRPRHDSP